MSNEHEITVLPWTPPSRQESVKEMYRDLHGHESHPDYGKLIAIGALHVPDYYKTAPPTAGQRMIAQHMRDLVADEGVIGFAKCWLRAGKLFAYAFNRVAFSNGDVWTKWRFDVEQWLKWIHQGPNYNGFFTEAIDRLQRNPAALGLTVEKMAFDRVWEAVQKGCPLIADLIEREIGSEQTHGIPQPSEFVEPWERVRDMGLLVKGRNQKTSGKPTRSDYNDSNKFLSLMVQFEETNIQKKVTIVIGYPDLTG